VPTRAWRLLPLLVLSAVFALAGCSGRPKLAEVKGTVTLKGKPLPKVMVEFIPDGATGPRATGTTDEKGQYTLVCDDKSPGAMVGANCVVLRDLTVWPDKPLGRKLETLSSKDVKPPRFPDEYSDLSRTPLKKEVKSEPNSFDIDVPAR